MPVAEASPRAGSVPPDCLSSSGRPASITCGQGTGFCHDVTSVWQNTSANGQPLPSGTTAGVAPNGSLNDIYACGPMPGNGSPGYGDAPFEASPNGFQCTELANRFLWDLWKKPPINDASPGAGGNLTGANFASVVAKTYGVPLVADGTARSPYLPGDIVSFKGDGTFGHVAVVIASAYTSADAGTGDYTVTIEQENATGTITKNHPNGTGTASITVTNWHMQLPAAQAATKFAVIPAGLGPRPWSVKSSPSPGAGNDLYSVSCVSASKCWAVGNSYDTAGASASLVEYWNGLKWSVQPSPDPAGAVGTYLQGVSCVAASRCEAVGYAVLTDNESFALAEVWNGTHWVIQRIPSPGPAKSVQVQLSSVSCTGSSYCVATGFSTPAANKETALAETFTGTNWTARAIPTPKGDSGAGGSSVTCLSATLCVAVGFGEVANCFGCGIPLMAVWNGSIWTVNSNLTVPTPASGDFSLSSVSCATQGDCVSIGNDFTGNGRWNMYTETWNGSAWSGRAINGDNLLLAISCPEPGSCTAVGTVGQGNGSPAASAIWDGTAWKAMNTASVSGLYNELDGVSCLAPYSCMAVGRTISNSGLKRTLTEAN
jgi:hypothetical protein